MTDPDPIRSARDEVAAKAVPRSSHAPTAEQAGDLIDRYKLLQQIGEGGMGTVWMAEQSEPVRRRVALKIIKLGMDTREVVARFDAERQALAMMDHPYIARVFDGGSTSTGRPYFVMELVRGVPITEHCDRASLGLRERLELFSQVCGALQHAHQKGVIHRDIKPSNVMVTLHDGVAVPKVIDFGIAKATNAELTQRTLFTRYEQMIGTPEYMAPEQAEMSGLDVDTRADVYSLGVLLYELVTGTKPFELHTALEKGYGELLRTIREVEPIRPSTRVSTRRDADAVRGPGQSVDLEQLSKRLRGDLDCIVMKALEKDRQRRYGTAAGLAEDIGRYLADEPVQAMPPSNAYRFRKAFRRHRRGFLVGGGAVALLVLGGAGTTIGLLRALDAERSALQSRDEADAARREAEVVAEFSREMLSGVDPRTAEGRDTKLLRGLLDGAMKKLEEQGLAGVPRAEFRLRSTIGSVYEAIGAYDQAMRALLPATTLAEVLDRGGRSELASVYASMGRVHLQRNEIEEARRCYDEVEAILRSSSGDHRLGLANLRNDLALLHQEIGDLEAAGRFCREAVATKRELGGGIETRLASTLGILGSVLSRRGDASGAKAAFDEALEVARLYAREGDPVSLIVALGNCAFIAGLLGDYEQQGAMSRESLALAEATFDGDHPFVAAAHSSLAGSLVASGRPLDALPHRQASRQMYLRLFGDRHPESVRESTFLATLLSDLGRVSESDELSIEALRGAEELGSADPILILNALEARGRILGSVGRYDEAEQVLRAALELQRAPEPGVEDNVYHGDRTSSLLVSLAGVLHGEGRRADRIELLREAVERRRAVAPVEGDMELANAIDNLGAALGGDEGESLLRESLSMKRRVVDGPHQDVATTAIKLGMQLASRGRFAEAVSLVEEAVAIRKEVLGLGNHRVLEAKVALGAVLQMEGRDLDRAVEILSTCIEEASSAEPVDRLVIHQAAPPLVMIHSSRGEPRAALPFAEAAVAASRELATIEDGRLALDLVNLGSVRSQLGESDAAIALFEEAGQLFEATVLEPDENAVIVFSVLGDLYLAEGDARLAARSFERLFAMARRVPQSAAAVRFNGASRLLGLYRDLEDVDAAMRTAERLVAAADQVFTDPSDPNRPFVLSGVRGELVTECVKAALLRSEPSEGLRMIEKAEAVARELYSIRESIADRPGFGWIRIDASSRLGGVALARAKVLEAVDEAGSAGALEEARRRISAAAEDMWGTEWNPGQVPPTAAEVVGRKVDLHRYLQERDPSTDQSAAIDLWRQRASEIASR